jgi:hypothetical protein
MNSLSKSAKARDGFVSSSAAAVHIPTTDPNREIDLCMGADLITEKRELQ